MKKKESISKKVMDFQTEDGWTDIKIPAWKVWYGT
jgi:hypothetical protein